MSLTLKTYVIVTGKTTSSSKHPIVASLQSGDTLEISTKIAPIGRGSSSLYATQVTVRNKTRDVEPYIDSMTRVAKLLSKIPHHEVDND